MLRSLILLCFVWLCLGVASAHPDPSAETTYLGNEGIMVTDGETKILFDPLYPNGFGTYQMVPEAMRTELMAGSPPYDNVDAIFISHMHPDHFSVGEIITYLQTHEQVRVFAPAQAVDWMRQETDDEAIFERVTAIGLERLDAPFSFKHNDLAIDVVRIPHGGWPSRSEVSNLVWRVTMADGITVMHLGDAHPLDELFAPHDDHWMAVRTDTAYPPYWFFTMGDGPHILNTRLNTLQATGIHVPTELPSDLFVSGADFFHTPGETRLIQRVTDAPAAE